MANIKPGLMQDNVFIGNSWSLDRQGTAIGALA